jgi:hypothetical protein
MKNILLGITTAISIVAILEAAGVLEWIDKDQSYQIAGYCDNTYRNLDNGKDGGGNGIDSPSTHALMEHAKETMRRNGILLKQEYFLSKSALDKLFDDKTATGIFIAPVFEEGDNINMLVGKAHCINTLINGDNFAYVIKTYCPFDCEME